MRDLDELFAGLARSRFRQRFDLGERERDYLARRGLDTVLAHAQEFIAARIAPAQPRNDGRQTPWRNHPVFIAQHATGTCCRRCIQRWHGLPAGAALDEKQQAYLVAVIARWLRARTDRQAAPGVPSESNSATHRA